MEKENYINSNMEDKINLDKILKEKEEKIKKRENDLETAAIRIENQINILNNKEKFLQTEKENLVKFYTKLNNDKNMLEKEKQIIEENRKNYLGKMRIVDNLRTAYVQNQLNNTNKTFNNYNDIENDYKNNMFSATNMTNTTSFFNTTNLNHLYNTSNMNFNKNINTINTMNNNAFANAAFKSNLKPINAEESFNGLKEELKKIHENNNGKNVFNNYLLNEDNYLKESNDKLKNQLKETYEKINNNSKQIFEGEFDKDS